MTDMDKDDKERMFMKMLSAMVSKVSKPQDHRWESMKFFYYGLCVLVKKGGLQLSDFWMKHLVMQLFPLGKI